MNGFARGFGTVTLSVIALLVVLAGIGYGVTVYLDDVFGNGATALVFAVLVGISMTVLIYTIAGFQNNQTHRAAGEDITDFAHNMSKTQTEQWRVQREWARQDREVATVSMRGALLEKKASLSREEWEWRQRQRQIEAERKRAEDAQAEAAEWAWIDEDADADAPVYYK